MFSLSLGLIVFSNLIGRNLIAEEEFVDLSEFSTAIVFDTICTKVGSSSVGSSSVSITSTIEVNITITKDSESKVNSTIGST